MIATVEKLWWRLVRFGFRLLYNEMAFTYDWVSKAVSLGQWRCWQRTSLRFLESAYDTPVLELAHGTGDLQLDLHDAKYRSVAFDLSLAMGRIAQHKLHRHGIQGQFVRGYAQDLPFADGTFPAVVCTFPTPFIIEQDTLTEIYRVLKPSGRLVVVMSGILTGGRFVKTFLEWLYEITGQRGEVSEEIIRPFQEAGFTARIVQESCSDSVVILIVAEKSG